MNEENEEQIADHNSQILKTAFCMFMNIKNPKYFLNFLPLDTEVIICFHFLFLHLRRFNYNIQFN